MSVAPRERTAFPRLPQAGTRRRHCIDPACSRHAISAPPLSFLVKAHSTCGPLATSSGQRADSPLHRSARSQLPVDSRQTVSRGPRHRAGQSGPVPVQASATSQAPLSIGTPSPDGWKASSGRRPSPSQLSATSQTPLIGRQTVPASRRRRGSRRHAVAHIMTSQLSGGAAAMPSWSLELAETEQQQLRRVLTPLSGSVFPFPQVGL